MACWTKPKTDDSGSEPQPRLAKLRTWPDFQGYGFNLTTEKAKQGQYIGKVDNDSPASTAGVREGDKIIEVNGVNVCEEKHHQVVARIKGQPGTVSLLLVDKETEGYYAKRGVAIRGDMPQVLVQETPERSSRVGAPRPRLCHLKKWPNFPGYGFNLHERLKQPGHLIGSVDPGSPAEATCLRVEDKIIEVNGRNMLECSHHQVVDKIRQYSDRVSLLVVDATTDRYYREQSVWIHSKMPNIEEIECPSSNDKAPRPRLFHLRKWPDFPGYGFDLHEEKTRPGHLIGSIDAGSPAAVTGLRRDDKIIEVNGHNVLEESHKKVVERIKENDNEVRLLVVDSVAEQYYNDNSIWVHGRMDNIDSIDCPTQSLTGGAEALTNGPVVQYAPRLSHLDLSPDFEGYGFDLQNEKGRSGHFIGNVEAGSPAASSGLQPGDRVVEVNGHNIEDESHEEVVDHIKAANGSLKLLVIDEEAWEYFYNNNIKISEELAHKKEVVQVNGEVSAESHNYAAARPTLSRLCHLRTSPNHDGYGFELHRLENRSGHYIGPVDYGSPAEAAGLHQGDEIIEVQGTNVQNVEHNDVVRLMRDNPENMTLLVTNSQPLVSPSAASTLNSAAQLRYPTPHARHSFLKKWSDFDGYGFDLYEIRKRPGPRVGIVSKGSPAEATGLMRDDYIIEVNGENVEKKRHPEVVKKIRKNPTEVRMLLVDNKTYDYFKDNSIRIHSRMANVQTIHCPDNRNVVTVSTAPREVHLQTKPDYDGLGFDLHELTNRTGHFIGSVEAGSPAEAAGLEKDDEIIQINSKSVINDSHEEVVERIRANRENLKLLVVGRGASTVYHSNALWVNTGNRDTVIMVPNAEIARDSTDIDGGATVISQTAPRPRLCKLHRWADFAGYGFNLHEERNRPGHIIGSVDEGSPGEAAGLKKDDKIVEVNGHNVLEASHQEVVEHIKQYEDRVELLVVDNDAKDYYEDNAIWVHSKMSNVQVIECPRRGLTAAEVAVPTEMTSANVEATPGGIEEPKLRLCILKKWQDFQGYGFNLHDEKGVAGHFIGQVDPGSPAEAAGLHEGDKIIEVNGQPVFEDDHHEVVSKVTSHPDEVQLLVMDGESDEFCRSHDIRPHGGMSNITVINCPPLKSGVAQANGTAEIRTDDIELSEHNGHAYVEPDREPAREPSPVPVRAPTPEPVRVPTPEPVRVPTPEPVRAPTPEPVREPSPEPVRQPSPTPEVNGVVETVAVTTVMSEMRTDTEVKSRGEDAFKPGTTRVDVETHEVKMNQDSGMVVIPAPAEETMVVSAPSGYPGVYVDVAQRQSAQVASAAHEEHVVLTSPGTQHATVGIAEVHSAQPSETAISTLREEHEVVMPATGYSRVDVVQPGSTEIVAVAPEVEMPSARAQQVGNNVVLTTTTEYGRVEVVQPESTEIVDITPVHSTEHHLAVQYPNTQRATVDMSEVAISQPGAVGLTTSNAEHAPVISTSGYNRVDVVQPAGTEFVAATPVKSSEERVLLPSYDSQQADVGIREVHAIQPRGAGLSRSNEGGVVITTTPVHPEAVGFSTTNEERISIKTTTGYSRVDVMQPESNQKVITPGLTTGDEIIVTQTQSHERVAVAPPTVTTEPVANPPITSMRAALVAAHSGQAVYAQPGYSEERVAVMPTTGDKIIVTQTQSHEAVAVAPPTLATEPVANPPITSMRAALVAAHSGQAAMHAQPGYSDERVAVMSTTGEKIFVTQSQSSDTVAVAAPTVTTEQVGNPPITSMRAALVEAHSGQAVHARPISSEERVAVTSTAGDKVIVTQTQSSETVAVAPPTLATEPVANPPITSMRAALVAAHSGQTAMRAQPGSVEERVEVAEIHNTDAKAVIPPVYTEERMAVSSAVGQSGVNVARTAGSGSIKHESIHEERVAVAGPRVTSYRDSGVVAAPITTDRGPEIATSIDDTPMDDSGVVLLSSTYIKRDLAPNIYTERTVEMAPVGTSEVHEVKSYQMVHYEGEEPITMTGEIESNTIPIVPPPPPLPEEMSGSHVVTSETEVVRVESSVHQEQPIASVAAGAITAVAVESERLSRTSSIASSRASSDDAVIYDVQEAELNTSLETPEVQVGAESYRVSQDDVTPNGIPEVHVTTEPTAASTEVEYVNSAAAVEAVHSSVIDVSSEPIQMSAEAEEEAASSAREYMSSTTTEVVTVTSQSIRDSSHVEVPVEAPPPTEFIDVRNGSGSNRSSSTTISDGFTQYAVTTEDVTEKTETVNEFMSSAEPVVIRTTTTSSSFSYHQRPAAETAAYRSSEPVNPSATPGQDPLSGSLQDVLSRVKSRKKPVARTGNLSMKEKYELFQQL